MKLSSVRKFISLDFVSDLLIGMILNIALLKILIRQTLDTLLAYGGTALVIIATLSALCYAGAACNMMENNKTKFINTGHRFYHSLLSWLYSIIFLASEMHISHFKSVLGYTNKTIVTTSIVILYVCFAFNLIRFEISFINGIYSLKGIFSKAFPKIYKDKDEIDPNAQIL